MTSGRSPFCQYGRGQSFRARLRSRPGGLGRLHSGEGLPDFGIGAAKAGATFSLRFRTQELTGLTEPIFVRRCDPSLDVDHRLIRRTAGRIRLRSDVVVAYLSGDWP